MPQNAEIEPRRPQNAKIESRTPQNGKIEPRRPQNNAKTGLKHETVAKNHNFE